MRGLCGRHIGPIKPRVIAGVPGFYGQYTYRQMTPWDQVLPGMVRLTTRLRAGRLPWPATDQQAWVKGEQLHHAGPVVPGCGRANVERASARALVSVFHDGLWREVHLPAGLPHSVTPVDVLAIQEEPLVHPPTPSMAARPNEHGSAEGPIDWPGASPVELIVNVLGEDGATRTVLPNGERRASIVSGLGNVRIDAWTDPSGLTSVGTTMPTRGFRGQVRLQYAHTPGPNDDIRVENENVVRWGEPGAFIDRHGVSPVRTTSHQAHVREELRTRSIVPSALALSTTTVGMSPSAERHARIHDRELKVTTTAVVTPHLGDSRERSHG